MKFFVVCTTPSTEGDFFIFPGVVVENALPARASLVAISELQSKHPEKVIPIHFIHLPIFPGKYLISFFYIKEGYPGFGYASLTLDRIENENGIQILCEEIKKQLLEDKYSVSILQITPT